MFVRGGGKSQEPYEKGNYDFALALLPGGNEIGETVAVRICFYEPIPDRGETRSLRQNS